MGLNVFRDADPARNEKEADKFDAQAHRHDFAIETDAYSRNVFYDIGDQFGVLEPSGKWRPTLDAFRNILKDYGALATDVGTIAAGAPLRDAAAPDFRPTPDSAARGSSVKVFVPWSLYETVAEWNFYPVSEDPARILDEHWCMSPFYTRRDDYHKKPTYPLTGVNIGLTDYESGPLENWTTGALHFNGKDQYAVLSNADIMSPVELKAHGREENVTRTVTGANLSSPQIFNSSFLVEVFFKTPLGQTNGTLIQKMSDTGWKLALNDRGGVSMFVKGGLEANLASRHSVSDGRWHHVLAELDRKQSRITIYLDGELDASIQIGPQSNPLGSLANDADLYVGGTPQGDDLNGAIDFMRIARGTLTDSKTTIQELYAWEFQGPFLDDFAGRERDSGAAAGALAK